MTFVAKAVPKIINQQQSTNGRRMILETFVIKLWLINGRQPGRIATPRLTIHQLVDHDKAWEQTVLVIYPAYYSWILFSKLQYQ